MITEENMNGVPEIVDAIVKSGRADLTLRNKKGLNVMHVAAGLGNIWFFYFTILIGLLKRMFLILMNTF